MRLISCKFNIDTASVELKYEGGTMVSIYTPAVEDEVAKNRYQCAELDRLVYHDPVAYAELVLNGGVRKYLDNVTEYRRLAE